MLESLQTFISKHRIVLSGIVLGSIAGYAWYLQVGCPNGTCAITSNPFRSMAYFALIGGFFAHSFVKKTPQPEPIRIDDESNPDETRKLH